jgi:hypothetical protein
MPLKVIRSLEEVEILQVTAKPKLEELYAKHWDPLSPSPAVRQRPHGLAQYCRDDRPTLAKYQRNDPQIYPTSKSRKEKNTCKGDLEGVDSEFLPSFLSCNEVPYKLHWKVTPREILRQQIQRNVGFPLSLFRSDDLGTQDCGSQTQVLLQDSVWPRILNGYDMRLAERAVQLKKPSILLQGGNKIHLPDGKAAVGRIPERSESLEQAMINPQPHEWGKLAKNSHDASMVILPKESPPMSHPLDVEVVKTKCHQGVEVAARRGHALKGLKNGENREFLVKKGEKNSRDGCWLEKESRP